MFKSIAMTLKLVLISFLAGVALMACGQSGFEALPADGGLSFKSPTTGHTTTIKSPKTGQSYKVDYTPAGDLKLYNSIKSDIALKRTTENTSEQQIVTDKKLAQSIQSIKVQRTILPEQRLNNFYTEISLKGLTNPLRFTTVSPESKITTEREVQASNRPDLNFNYSLVSKCHETTCLRRIMTLKKTTWDDQLVAEAHFIYSKISTTVKLEVSKYDTKKTTPTAVAKLKKAKTATKESFVVLEGPSYSTITVESPTTDQPPLLQVTTALATTDQASLEVKNIAVADVAKEDVQASLEGNDPVSGSVAVNVDFTQEQGEIINTRMYFSTPSHHETSIHNEDETQQKNSLLKNYSNPIIPIIHNGEASPIALEITEKLEKYRNDPIVMAYIQQWQGLGQVSQHFHRIKRSRMQNFLNILSELGHPIGKALHLINAPQQIAYVMIVESNYANLNSDGSQHPEQFNAKIVAHEGKTNKAAAGPLQITFATGLDILKQDLTYNENTISKIFGIELDIEKLINSSLVESDSRGFLLPSVLLAGTYAKYLYKNFFKHDPALIPLGYNKGPGSIKLKDDFLKRHDGFNVSLDLIREYHMAPEDGIEYAYLVLSAQFIGSNPTMYGFDVEPLGLKLNEIPNLYPDGFDKALVGL